MKQNCALYRPSFYSLIYKLLRSFLDNYGIAKESKILNTENSLVLQTELDSFRMVARFVVMFLLY